MLCGEPSNYKLQITKLRNVISHECSLSLYRTIQTVLGPQQTLHQPLLFLHSVRTAAIVIETLSHQAFCKDGPGAHLLGWLSLWIPSLVGLLEIPLRHGRISSTRHSLFQLLNMKTHLFPICSFFFLERPRSLGKATLCGNKRDS